MILSSNLARANRTLAQVRKGLKDLGDSSCVGTLEAFKSGKLNGFSVWLVFDGSEIGKVGPYLARITWASDPDTDHLVVYSVLASTMDTEDSWWVYDLSEEEEKSERFFDTESETASFILKQLHEWILDFNGSCFGYGN